MRDFNAGYDVRKVNDLMAELSGYAGWQSLNSKVKELADKKTLHTLMGNPYELINKPLFFGGAPGTGKTWAASFMMRVLYEMGYISEKRITKADASELISPYVGVTLKKAEDFFERGRGGVILIENLSRLMPDDKTCWENNLCKELFEVITRYILDDGYNSETYIIFTDYYNFIENFFKLNEKVARKTEVIRFEPFTEEELYSIFKRLCKASQWEIGVGVEEKCLDIFKKLARSKHFANGRTARNLFEKAAGKRAERVLISECDVNSMAYSSILAEDIPSLEELNGAV